MNRFHSLLLRFNLRRYAKGAVNVLLTVLYRAHHAFRAAGGGGSGPGTVGGPQERAASLEAHEVRLTLNPEP
jgi:hypothetical protein